MCILRICCEFTEEDCRAMNVLCASVFFSGRGHFITRIFEFIPHQNILSTYTDCKRIKVRVLIQHCIIGSKLSKVHAIDIVYMPWDMSFTFSFFFFTSILYSNLSIKTDCRKMTCWLKSLLYYLCAARCFFSFNMFCENMYFPLYLKIDLSFFPSAVTSIISRKKSTQWGWASEVIPVMMWTVVCSGWKASWLRVCVCVYAYQQQRESLPMFTLYIVYKPGTFLRAVLIFFCSFNF